MIEVAILNHLKTKLDVPVFLERPEQIEVPFVLFERTSGSGKHGLINGTFAFQSYADSKFKTIELNQKTKKAVESLIELDVISGVHLNNDYDFTDTRRKEYRYQAVFFINYYEEN